MSNKIILINEKGERNVSERPIKGLDIVLSGRDNTIEIEYPNLFINCKIELDGTDNYLHIGRSDIGFRNLEILCLADGHNRRLTIGRDCSCEGLSIFHHNNDSSLSIGNNVMFARNCCIQTSDSHAIFEKDTHKLLNSNTHFEVGDNVWVAQGTTLLKNAKIPSNTIIGTMSVVTKPFEEENTILAGNPAKVIKKNCQWSRTAVNRFSKKVNNIDFKDISFVVQGAIVPEWTEKTLKSIRTFFPSSFIILSTWEGADTTQISYLCDKILYNKDPGHIVHSDLVDRQPQNLNRQILSSFNGLKQVKTKYAVRLRSDTIIKSTDFLDYFGKFNDYDKNYKLFKERIVSFAGYSSYWKNGKRSWDFCMHDYAYFGLTEDLLNLFNIPLMNKEEQFFWRHHDYPQFSHNIAPEIISFIKSNQTNYQYHAEQFILVRNFEKLKNISINFKHMLDFNDENVELFQRLLTNNFVPLYSERLGISLPKDKKDFEYGGYTSPLDYTYKEFIELYNKYANGSMNVPKIDDEREKWDRPGKIGHESKRKPKRKTKLYKFFHLYWLRRKK